MFYPRNRHKTTTDIPEGDHKQHSSVCFPGSQQALPELQCVCRMNFLLIHAPDEMYFQHLKLLSMLFWWMNEPVGAVSALSCLWYPCAYSSHQSFIYVPPSFWDRFLPWACARERSISGGLVGKASLSVVHPLFTLLKGISTGHPALVKAYLLPASVIGLSCLWTPTATLWGNQMLP